MIQRAQQHCRLFIGIALAVATIALASCAPHQAGIDSTANNATDTSTVQPAEWSPEIDCSACHNNEAESAQNVNTIAGFHATTANVNCVTCHTDEELLKEAHGDMTGKVPRRLKKTEVSQDSCLTCHRQQDLADATADSVVLTDMNGKVVNPHDLPVVEDHEDITCTSCHNGHSDDPIDQTALDTCTSCHHADVFECNTCH